MALKRRTFRETFVDGGLTIPYPPDDLAAFEAASFTIGKTMAELADPARMTWIADCEGRFLGYAQVGPVKLPHPDCRPGDGEVYQLYLLEEAQGLGLGRRLLETALDYLRIRRPGSVWLGVWSGNLKAQAFYAGWGFVKHGEYDFPVGTWRDREFILRLPV